jgi:hypothetical protein
MHLPLERGSLEPAVDSGGKTNVGYEVGGKLVVAWTNAISRPWRQPTPRAYHEAVPQRTALKRLRWTLVVSTIALNAFVSSVTFG